ncbi:hypothetical protein TWF281_004575 [Arthrobotrys megalospora]
MSFRLSKLLNFKRKSPSPQPAAESSSLEESNATTDMAQQDIENIDIAPSPFMNLPNEIHIEIFKNCATFTDAIAFSATCQQLQSVWKTHRRAVASQIARSGIVAFDDALRTVRATNMAEEQYKALRMEAYGISAGPDDGPRPPNKIPIHSLGADSCLPSHEEILQVFDLKDFVEAALFLGHEQKHIHIFCQQSSSAMRLPVPCQYSVDSTQAGIPPEETDFKIYASMYRYFFISAVLSTVYWEPFFASDPRAAALRRDFAYPAGINASHIQNRRITADELTYFRRWPCYNKRHASQSQLDEVFGEPAQYLVGRGRKEAIWDWRLVYRTVLDGDQRQTSDRDFQTAGAVQTIMMIIACHELFWCVAQQQLNSAGRAVHRNPMYLSGVRYKRAPITFLGIHGAMEAIIPTDMLRNYNLVQNFQIQLVPKPTEAGADRRSLKQVRLLRLFHELLYHDGRADELGSNLPYELGFFEYALRRHFGLRVQFAWGYSHTTYSRYLAHGTAFRAVEPFRRDVQDILSRVPA